MPIKDFLGGAYIPDSVQKLFPVTAAPRSLEPLVIHAKTNLGKACLALCLPCHNYGPVGSKSAVFALRGAAGWTCRYTSTFETGKSGFFRGQPVDATGDLWDAYDNGLSNAYFILKARAMGFDTLIMGMRNADAIRALFEIPENETVLAVIALGYRAQDPKTPTHRPLDEVVKFY